jgi:ABC-2 type transport system ATP-binding protein
MSSQVVETRDLTRKFGDLTAVNTISMNVEKGELFGLLGPNGAGKTTFLKLLTGQLEPTTGSSTVLGIDPAKNPVDVKTKIGIVPEIGMPPSFLTVREYLQYIGLIRNLESREEKAEYWIKFLDMEDVQNTLGKDLSKGTRQKLMLAAGLIHEPPLVFLDEPFIGLDPYHQKKIREFLSEYRSKGGTIFMCTHIMEIAEKMCTRVAIIDHGGITARGTMKELVGEGETLADVFLRHTRNDK